MSTFGTQPISHARMGCFICAARLPLQDHPRPLAPAMNPGLDLRQQITLAEHAINTGNLDFASSILQQLLRQSPNLPPALELLAQIALRQGQMAQAAQLLHQATQSPAASFKAHYLLGSLYLSQGQYAASLPYLHRAIVQGGEFAEGLHNLGMALSNLGRHTEALPCLERAVELQPGQAELWNSRGQVLQNLSRHDEAVASFEKALALQPQHAGVWHNLGKSHFSLRQLPEAAHDFRQALAFGQNNGAPFIELNQYLLASVEEADTPDKPPTHYIKDLFDNMSASFDDTLVGHLRYQAPEVLTQHLEDLPLNPDLHVLDLGCGTGLCGKLIRPRAKVLHGVDLSPGMLGKAESLGVYDALACAELHEHLGQLQQPYDLIMAADVFIYVGRLDGVFEQIGRALKPGGILCFSIELPKRTGDYVITSTGRYAHAEGYLLRLAQDHGLTVLKSVRHPIRMEQGQPVDGLYLYMTHA